MLRFLKVTHLAVIDAVEVEFDPGLNVLTGETGAGKSILVEAVGLLLGGRASGDLVRTGEDVASIEAIFESAGEEILVRREITAQGRSRAFVNGALATASALRDLSSRLVELHGQHEHQTLLDPTTHLAVLDTFGGLTELSATTAAAYAALVSARDALSRARAAAKDRDARLEVIVFQLADLDRAALKPLAPGDVGEDVELHSLRQVLSSAERVERLCAESYASLYESDAAILSSLGHVWRRVGELAALDPQFQQYVDAREGIKSQLEDLALFLRRYADSIEASPARLQQVEERLALLERLKRKHGPSLADVIAKRDALRREATDLERGDERIQELEGEYRSARTSFLSAAGKLSKERRKLAVGFAKSLESLLAELAMEQTRFDVRFAEAPDEASWTAGGVDIVEFFVSPNPGEELRPLARIVSGGELSRLMLAIKVLTFRARLAGAERNDPAPARRVRGAGAPGLIFDEVDAGIGGRVADVVGRKLRTLGSGFQVLCITHLPQIAAYADTHFAIDKRVQSGRTRTTVKSLDVDGRVSELSRMLGGEAVTETLRRSAREMLEERSGSPSRNGLPSRSAPGSARSGGVLRGPESGAASEDKRKRKGESESPRKA